MTRFKQTDKVAPSKHTDNDIFLTKRHQQQHLKQYYITKNLRFWNGSLQ